MTSTIQCTQHDLEQIKSGARKELISLFRKGIRVGDNIIFQSTEDEHSVRVESIYEGKGVNQKYTLFTWQKDHPGWELQPIKPVAADTASKPM